MSFGSLTYKQQEIMDTVLKGNAQGRFLTIRELHEKLPYKCSIQALQCSLRILTNKYQLVETQYEKRKQGKGSSERIVVPTMLAYRMKAAGQKLQSASISIPLDD